MGGNRADAGAVMRDILAAFVVAALAVIGAAVGVDALALTENGRRW